MDLSEITARAQITELINRYTDAVLRTDRESFAACWSEAAEWLIFGEHFKGRDTITNFYMGLVGDVKFVRHLSHSPQMRVSGDAAEARWQVTENLYRDETGGILILGIYNDAYVKENGAWVFAKRRFDELYRGPFPMDKDGFATLPEEIAGSF